MIAWKNPQEELPAEDERRSLAVLTYHWKEQGYQSCEIFFGYVEYGNPKNCLSVRVTNNDDIGQGAASWYLTDAPYPCEQAIAWAFADEINLPNWLEMK